MKFALLVAGLLAGWAASAGAILPPVPPVPTLPQVPTHPALPPPPRATRPPPKIPAAPRVSKPRIAKPALPISGGSDGGGGGAASSNDASAGVSQQASARHAESRPARVYRLHFSRNWISRAGPKQRRQTALVFVLKRATVVEFVVIEIAPECRRIGRFRVSGRAGVNRVRFRGRIGRRVLAPGTYRITARTVPRGRALVDTKLVIVARPERDEIASARSANACRSKPDGLSTSTSLSGSTPGKPGAGTTPAARDRTERPASPSRDGGVLGTKFTKAVDAVRTIPLWVFVLLGLAIALLALAALPLKVTPSRRAALALAHHRGMVALGGAATLVAVTVAYALH